MLARLGLLRGGGGGCCLSPLVFARSRPIHFTSPLTSSNTPPPPSPSLNSPKKDPPSTRSLYSASDISDIVLRRLHLREQRGVVKALIIGSGILLISTVAFLYIFRKPLKNQTVAQVADVAKSSLEQDSVRQQVHVLSQELVQNLLADMNILSKVLLFLERIIDDPSTKQTLIRLLQRLMIDDEMQKNVSNFTSQIIYDVMKKTETEIQLGQLFRRALLQKDNQDALYILLKEFIEDQKTKQILGELALEVTHQVLNDESVKMAATMFVKDILNDSSLQQQSGDFAWNAVKRALKPRWFTSDAKAATTIPTDEDRSAEQPKEKEQDENESKSSESDFKNSMILTPVVLTVRSSM